MATLDATTLAEYTAEVNATDRAQVIVDALTSTVYGRVYDSEGNIMGQGTMSSPWATVSGDQVIPSTLNGFYVSSAGSVNDGWYFRFEAGSRYVQCSFGVTGSGKEAIWSLPSWDVGTRAGISSSAITVSGNVAPEFTVAPTSSIIGSSGGTIQFTAVDPNDDPVTYSLPATRTGITIGASTGLVTVSSAAAGTSGSITVRASDGGLSTDTSCSVSVLANDLIKWNPGFYIYLSPSGGHNDGASQRAADLAWFQNYANNSNIKGFYIQKYLSAFETGTTADYSAGFAMLDYYLGLCDTYNKRLCVEFEHVGFGTNPLPSYWQSQGWTHTYFSGFNISANIGISACRDRLIALIEAYGARYNDHPLLEIVGLEETTTTAPSGVTSTTWTNNYKAILTAAVEAWPNTLFRSTENGQLGQAEQINVYQHIDTLNNAGTGCIITGGPDHEDGLTNPLDPTNEKSWKQLWRGQTTISGNVWQDARGLLPFYGETQERGFYPTGDTPANICTYQINLMDASHVTFLNYTRWTEVLAAITAISGATNGSVPACLTGRTVTGGT